MIEQKRYVDERDSDPMGFLTSVIDRYNISKYTKDIEIRSRSLNYDCSSSPHETDDKIVQLVADNILIAMVFLRRTDGNHTEETSVIVEQGIRLFRRMLKLDEWDYEKGNLQDTV